MDVWAESSRKFNKILQETRAASEKSHHFESGMVKWKRIIVFGNRRKEHELKPAFPNEPLQTVRFWLYSFLAREREPYTCLWTFTILLHSSGGIRSYVPDDRMKDAEKDWAGIQLVKWTDEWWSSWQGTEHTIEPSTVKLKGWGYSEMRIISQPCLKMFQQERELT